MIIEKLEIESFGKFKDKKIEFKEGINILCGENESGKSTICAFILAMFYDFAEKGKGIRDDLRTRYLPWSGESMSGSVHFSHENKHYILKRRMGKTPKGAKVTLLDGDTWEEISDERKESPGEYFFGVPYDSFFKTVYISQLGVSFERGRKDELFERLSNINQSGDEDISYRKTIQSLEKQLTELISVSGTGGKIVRLRTEIDSLKKKLFKAEEMEAEYKNAAVSASEAEKTKERLCQERDMLFAEKLSAEKHEKFLSAKNSRERFAFLKNEKEKKEAELSEAYERLNIARQIYEKMDHIEGADDIAAALETLEEKFNALKQKLSEYSLKREKLETELLKLKTEKKIRVNPVLISISVILLVFSVFLSLYVSPVLAVMIIPSLISAFFACSKVNKKADINEKYAELEKMKEELSEEKSIALKQEEIKKEIEDILKKTHASSVAELLNKISERKSAEEKVKAGETEYRLIKESLEVILPEFYKLEQIVEFDEAPEDISYSGANSSEIEKEISLINNELLVWEKKLLEANAAVRIIAENEEPSYSEIANKISAYELEEKELLKVYNAIRTALELLKESYEELKSGFTPDLIRYVKEAVIFLTDGRYSEIRISDDYKLNVMSDGEIVSAEYLSGGTYDVLYLSLRFGLLKVLFGGKIPFLILDDAFLQLDSRRTERAAEYIKKENPMQVLYFTCRDELKDIFGGENL